MRTLYRRLRRWREDRCDECGKPFRWKEGRYASGNRDGIVRHGPCASYLHWRNKAEERLTILAFVCEVWNVSSADVAGVAEMRSEWHDPSADHVRFRVFRDLELRRDGAA